MRLPSAHCLRLGLQGSLIPFAPLAFVHQRQIRHRYLPSPLVFFLISMDFTPTPGIPVPPNDLKSDDIFRSSQVKPGSLTKNLSDRLRYSLRPINPDNACTLRITAAAGT